VSGAWSPRRLSVSALLAFLVVLLTNPVAVSADKDASTTEHDDHHTTDCDGDHAGHDHCGGGDTTPAQTVSGAVQNAGAGALLLSAAAAYVVS
jgi:hypothetical protein